MWINGVWAREGHPAVMVERSLLLTDLYQLSMLPAYRVHGM